jgi:hypothetical protein
MYNWSVNELELRKNKEAYTINEDGGETNLFPEGENFALSARMWFIKARDVKDYPRMIKDVPHKEWQDFFIQEAKKLKQSIISS